MKVIFVVSDFDIGGITSSLKNLSNELIRRGHEVDILNLPMAKNLPNGFEPDVRLINIEGFSRFWKLTPEYIRNSSLIKRPVLWGLGAGKKLLNKAGLWNCVVFSKLKIETEYDVAIGFRQSPVDYYVTKNAINARKYIGFYHADPDYAGDTSSWDSCLTEMDRIAGVSDATCEGLLRHYPVLAGKLRTVYNLFETDKIKRNAFQEQINYDSNCFNIVTVSRIEFFTPKNHQRIPEIAMKLKNEGIKFHWIIVGDGPDREKLEQMIRADSLEKEIELVGTKSNPYPYIKAADLFVLTSTSESYGMVVMESLILGTPVVAGDYPALKEILSDDYGIRAENSVAGIYNGIRQMITCKEEYKTKKRNCLNFVYSTDKTYQQFLDLCGDEYAQI